MATKIWLARSNDTNSWRGDFFGFGEVWPVPNDLAADFVTRLDHMRIGSITTLSSLEEGGRNSVAGPTSPQNTRKYCGSGVIESDFTISGTMTFNIWAFEANASANATIRAVVMRYRASDHSYATIIDSSFGTELGTTRAVRNWTGTPTSTAMKRGDRILFTISNDDATAVNMGAGFNVQWEYNGHTNAADGDSWFQFTETFDWMDHAEWEAGLTGTKLYLRNTDSPVSVGKVEKAMSSVRGSGVTSVAKRPTTNGPVAWPGEQVTETDGGTAIEWYTDRLNAFTLSFPTTCVFTAATGIDFDGPAMVAELAVCDGDGTNAVVIAQAMPTATAPNAMETMVRSTTQLMYADFAAPDKAITTGQRLRLRFYISDCYYSAVRLLDTTNLTTVSYDGDTDGLDGDRYLIFSQSVTTADAGFLEKKDKRIVGPTHLGAVAGTTVYTVPTSAAAWIRHIHVINPTGAQRTVTLSVGPDSAQTRVFDSRAIAAGGVIDERRAAEHWLNEGEVIQANADAAASCVIVIDAIEYSLS